MKCRLLITLPAIALVALTGCGDISGSEAPAAPPAERTAQQTSNSQPSTKSAPKPKPTKPVAQASAEPEAPVANPREGWREVTCRVDTPGDYYEGPCFFRAQRGGTFTIERANNAPMSGATSITVAVIAEGEADVRGLTSDGINSRWGSAKRSQTDRACWEGSDFNICAF